MISLQVFPRIKAIRTRGPDGKIRTAGERVIIKPIRFKDLGFQTAEMLQEKINLNNTNEDNDLKIVHKYRRS